MLNVIFLRAPKAFVEEIVFLLKCWATVKELDLLVISGGGQLLDCWGGSWGFPYTIFKWILLAKLCGVQRIFLNVGAGPLQHRLSKAFFRKALSLGDYVSFRDSKSMGLIRSIGYGGPAEVVVDSVYGLEVPTSACNTRLAGDPRHVAISPMAYCDPRVYWNRDQQLYDRFVARLATFGSGLIERGYHVTLFSTDISFDKSTIEELKRAILGKLGTNNVQRLSDPTIDTTEDLLRTLSSMDYVVTCRFHGVVFAHLLNKPVLALSHHTKVRTLMEELRLDDYCLEIQDWDADAALIKFAGLVEGARQAKVSMSESLMRFKKKLRAQFDGLFGTEFN